jgi:hypothetical protein
LSDKSSILTDTEKAVVETITMRMHTDEALAYLKDCSITMVKRSYYRYKKKVEAMKWQRLMHAANLFTHQHLQRMDRLELVEKLMWTEYEKEKSAYRRVGILQAIVAMQPYISGYYDATTYVLSKRLRTDVTAKPQLGYLEQDKFNAKLKEKREQNLSRDQKLTNQEFDEQEQKEIRDMNLN